MALSPSLPRERLSHLLKEDGNTVCADCKEPDPTWASTNHGTFICTQCAGVHRRVHIYCNMVHEILERGVLIVFVSTMGARCGFQYYNNYLTSGLTNIDQASIFTSNYDSVNNY